MRPSTAIACLALFISLGGGSYAAFSQVSTPQVVTQLPVLWVRGSTLSDGRWVDLTDTLERVTAASVPWAVQAKAGYHPQLRAGLWSYGGGHDGEGALDFQFYIKGGPKGQDWQAGIPVGPVYSSTPLDNIGTHTLLDTGWINVGAPPADLLRVGVLGRSDAPQGQVGLDIVVYLRWVK